MNLKFNKIYNHSPCNNTLSCSPNISVFQIKAGKNYSLQDFDEDLRAVMKRAGVKQERICFNFDESNCLPPAFLEKMNALLASG
jgi:dynein heavy chain 1